MNCTRGGGWVTSGGDCSSPGGSGIAPLILSSGISTNVSRPYAKYLVTTGICSHFADGDPGDRLRRAGYAGDYRENIGCRSAAQPVRVGPRDPPLLPEREAVRRLLPLREHHVDEDEVRRDRRLGRRTAGSGSVVDFWEG